MKTKPWYKRRRYWTLAILAVLVYFCLIPSPLRVSPQTTGVTSPLLPNGDVDYFGAYEQTYIHKLSPPEDNGMRLIIAALGPRTLEQAHIANTVPWEEMPTHEDSKYWFNNRWIPLCEHMYIDPYAKPKFLDNPDYYSFMRKEWESNNQDEHARYDGKLDEELRQKFIAAPWTAETHPNIARWLEERSPVLDLFGIAVRKPNFACYRWRPENGNLIAVLLPDIQSMRNFGRELSIRITERLGHGDIDGAWYDVMSMFYLSRKHYIHDPFFVVNFVGIAIEGMGWESAKVILQYADLTPEQLERFAQDLDSLPRRMTLYSDFEFNITYAGLQYLQLSADKEGYSMFVSNNKREQITDLTSFFLWLFGGGVNERNTPMHLALLPFDRNIAGKRITEFHNTARQMSNTSAWNVNSTLTKKHYENMAEIIRAKEHQLTHPWKRVLPVPLIRTRSQLVADHVVCLLTPAILAAEYALERGNTRLDLLRLAVALERYKMAEGEYPSDLEALVPQFLEEVPLDPFTGRKTFVYKVAPDAETAVLLHSSEWDESDGNKEDLFIRLKRHAPQEREV